MSNPGLHLDGHETQPGFWCLAVAGEIDMATTEALAQAITDAVLNPRLTTVHIDLGAVTFMDASGITTLIEGMNLAVRHRTAYQVVNARGIVRRVLVITDLPDILTRPSDHATTSPADSTS